MTSERDLPEGVIDADPAGGWESAETADGETAERNREALGSPALSDDPAPADRESVDSETVESDQASQGADPDLGISDES